MPLTSGSWPRPRPPSVVHLPDLVGKRSLWVTLPISSTLRAVPGVGDHKGAARTREGRGPQDPQVRGCGPPGWGRGSSGLNQHFRPGCGDSRVPLRTRRPENSAAESEGSKVRFKPGGTRILSCDPKAERRCSQEREPGVPRRGLVSGSRDRPLRASGLQGRRPRSQPSQGSGRGQRGLETWGPQGGVWWGSWIPPPSWGSWWGPWDAAAPCFVVRLSRASQGVCRQ